MKHTQEFKFEKIVVWQKAMDLGERLNELVERFPEKEKFNLSSQMLRAVDSVALNISEGSIGQSNLEFKRFMGYAIRSLAETVTCLHKANRRKYINENEFNAVYSDSFNLMNMMAAFRRNIK
ncbi:four helix bundle protein [Roseivirga pacifica]|uniref:four helix bundle protein n=1 Tax=Roseivirga pacifica TaxID=1267423 RepID=UPI00209429E5|nr:four helix bundle protein [Roseivirga pacifica]MCO6358268.1 four helix bundle protein [Roseivirga pacifica]MCO6366268.1 four helix bundle protein [Roseivirga pacifica]MCO6369181.1 four helix bundle protein [Roseivirga pacifica]MCO6373999.1 four helix bundle protein [Roseivirga pacifica]MCO6378375.1 four helix bundle protein [Roseivirga pacifica]